MRIVRSGKIKSIADHKMDGSRDEEMSLFVILLKYSPEAVEIQHHLIKRFNIEAPQVSIDELWSETAVRPFSHSSFSILSSPSTALYTTSDSSVYFPSSCHPVFRALRYTEPILHLCARTYAPGPMPSFIMRPICCLRQ